MNHFYAILVLTVAMFTAAQALEVMSLALEEVNTCEGEEVDNSKYYKKKKCYRNNYKCSCVYDDDDLIRTMRYDQITASSTQSIFSKPESINIMINSVSANKESEVFALSTFGAWCALINTKGQHLQVDLGKVYTITAFGTQGKPFHNGRIKHCVTKYMPLVLSDGIWKAMLKVTEVWVPYNPKTPTI
jgi:hypothetical protein